MSKKLWNTGRMTMAATLAASLLAGCVSVRPATVVAPVAPTTSKDDAARKLALVQIERERAEGRFVAGEQQCYTRFFTNMCLDRVREEHRTALANVRAIEIEAQHFQRQTRVEERDAALVASQQQFDVQQARLLVNPPPAAKQEQPAPPARPPARRDRPAEQAAREQRQRAQEQAGAASREANITAFEARRAASVKRLQDVERKKADTAKAQAARAAAEQAAPAK